MARWVSKMLAPLAFALCAATVAHAFEEKIVRGPQGWRVYACVRAGVYESGADADFPTEPERRQQATMRRYVARGQVGILEKMTWLTWISHRRHVRQKDLGRPRGPVYQRCL